MPRFSAGGKNPSNEGSSPEWAGYLERGIARRADPTKTRGGERVSASAEAPVRSEDGGRAPRRVWPWKSGALLLQIRVAEPVTGLPESSTLTGSIEPDHVRRDQGRHPFREGNVAHRQLERTDLRAVVENRGDDSLGLAPKCKALHEPPVLHEQHPGRGNPARLKRFEDHSKNHVGIAASVENALDCLERASLVDRTAVQAAAISQSPSSKPRIASRYQSGIGRARRSCRSTSTSVCVAVTISTSSSTR